MQLVILAAGNGKRMGNLTKNIPKPMLTLKGKPILEHKMNILPADITEIIMIVGYRREQIMKHFGNSHNGRKIIYVLQNRLNGSGGALHLAKSLLRDKFLVMMGDDLYHKKDIRKMMKHELAVLGHKSGNPSAAAIRTNHRGHLVDIIEKPKKNEERIENTALYTLTKKFFEYDLVSIGNGEFGLPQTLAAMARDHKVKVERATLWHKINSVEEFQKAEEILHKFI